MKFPFRVLSISKTETSTADKKQVTETIKLGPVAAKAADLIKINSASMIVITNKDPEQMGKYTADQVIELDLSPPATPAA